MSVEPAGPKAINEEDLKIRQMRHEDIPALQAIDRRITERIATWKNVDLYLAGDPLLCFVAEHQGQLIGFLLGDVKSYEFGLPQSGWVEAMGVDPSYQRARLGVRLVNAFVDRCRRSGINSVQALIKRDDARLQAFFAAAGFGRGDLINMEKVLREGD